MWRDIFDMFHQPVGWYCSYCATPLVTGTSERKHNKTKQRDWVGPQCNRMGNDPFVDFPAACWLWGYTQPLQRFSSHLVIWRDPLPLAIFPSPLREVGYFFQSENNCLQPGNQITISILVTTWKYFLCNGQPCGKIWNLRMKWEGQTKRNVRKLCISWRSFGTNGQEGRREGRGCSSRKLNRRFLRRGLRRTKNSRRERERERKNLTWWIWPAKRSPEKVMLGYGHGRIYLRVQLLGGAKEMSLVWKWTADAQPINQSLKLWTQRISFLSSLYTTILCLKFSQHAGLLACLRP